MPLSSLWLLNLAGGSEVPPELPVVPSVRAPEHQLTLSPALGLVPLSFTLLSSPGPPLPALPPICRGLGRHDLSPSDLVPGGAFGCDGSARRPGAAHGATFHPGHQPPSGGTRAPSWPPLASSGGMGAALSPGSSLLH